jgi:hypothetical protein
VLNRISHTKIEIVEGKCGLAEFGQIFLPGRAKTVFYEKLNSLFCAVMHSKISCRSMSEKYATSVILVRDNVE